MFSLQCGDVRGGIRKAGEELYIQQVGELLLGEPQLEFPVGSRVERQAATLRETSEGDEERERAERLFQFPREREEPLGVRKRHETVNAPLDKIGGAVRQSVKLRQQCGPVTSDQRDSDLDRTASECKSSESDFAHNEPP